MYVDFLLGLARGHLLLCVVEKLTAPAPYRIVRFLPSSLDYDRICSNISTPYRL